EDARRSLVSSPAAIPLVSVVVAAPAIAIAARRATIIASIGAPRPAIARAARIAAAAIVVAAVVADLLHQQIGRRCDLRLRHESRCRRRSPGDGPQAEGQCRRENQFTHIGLLAVDGIGRSNTAYT